MRLPFALLVSTIFIGTACKESMGDRRGQNPQEKKLVAPDRSPTKKDKPQYHEQQPKEERKRTKEVEAKKIKDYDSLKPKIALL